MKKYLAMVVAALLCACCLGLAACGGSSSSSAASASAASGSASASAASESASASAASASAASESASAEASSAASESASAAASEEVNPELKAFAEEYMAACDELIAVVDKAKEAGSYDAVEAEWKAVSDKLDALNGEAQQWAAKYNSGELTAADKAYYNKVLLPAASKAASAGLEMIDLIK